MGDFRLRQQPQKVTILTFVAVQLEMPDFVGGTMAAMSFMYKGIIDYGLQRVLVLLVQVGNRLAFKERVLSRSGSRHRDCREYLRRYRNHPAVTLPNMARGGRRLSPPFFPSRWGATRYKRTYSDICLRRLD
jgi:hypothetical protein